MPITSVLRATSRTLCAGFAPPATAWRIARLGVYEGAPHGMCATLKERVNADLLASLKI